MDVTPTPPDQCGTRMCMVHVGLQTSVSATDHRHGCGGSLLSPEHCPPQRQAQQASRDILRIPSCSPLMRFAHHACYSLGSTENDMAKDIPPGPGGVGWSHDVRPLRLTPPLPFALRFILVDLGSASPQVGNHAKLQLVESREGTVHEHSNGCRLAEYRGQQ